MADDISIDRSLSNIKAAILRHPGDTIAGGVLQPLIKTIAPEINIRELSKIPSGPGALTKFVDLYLNDALPRFENSGGDNIYYINRGQLTLGQTEEAPVWKLFVSPYARQTILFNRNDGTFSATHSIDSVDEYDVVVPRVTPGEHFDLRVQFQDTLDDSYVAVLKEKDIYISQENQVEYSTWINSIKELVPFVYKKWGEYRRAALRRIFLSRADNLNLTAQEREMYEKAVNAVEHQAYSREPARAPMPSTPLATGRTFTAKRAVAAPKNDGIQHIAFDQIEEARNFAHLAVNLMNHDELRALPLSLGIFLDLINNTR